MIAYSFLSAAYVQRIQILCGLEN